MFIHALLEHEEKCERISKLITLITLEGKVRERERLLHFSLYTSRLFGF